MCGRQRPSIINDEHVEFDEEQRAVGRILCPGSNLDLASYSRVVYNVLQRQNAVPQVSRYCIWVCTAEYSALYG